MEITKQLLLQLVLILLNAFFAATEIAVISLNEKKVKARAEEGDKKAVRMLKMIEDPTQFLSTIQIGITLAGFLGSAFAADNFADYMTDFIVATFRVPASQIGVVDTVAVILITLILSFFTLVLGELVPKRVAMRHKEKLAEGVCGLITVLTVILKPIIWLLTVSTNAVARLFGIHPHDKDDPVSEEDIVLMLDAGADEGSLDENDIEYIKNVFKLDGMTAVDVMTPRKAVVFLASDATDEEIMQVIEEEQYSRIPVFTDKPDNIIGVLFTRDYLIKRSRADFTLEQAMFEPTFVPETAHLDVLFKDMQKQHNHIVILVNEYGETSGIVTMEDILEEIVGEIWDESDEAIEEIQELGNNTYRVLCSTAVEDFFTFFGVDPEEEVEATTVNGWLTETVGSIPTVGDVFTYRHLSVEVAKADDFMTHEIVVRVVPLKNEIEE